MSDGDFSLFLAAFFDGHRLPPPHPAPDHGGEGGGFVQEENHPLLRPLGVHLNHHFAQIEWSMICPRPRNLPLPAFPEYDIYDYPIIVNPLPLPAPWPFPTPEPVRYRDLPMDLEDYEPHPLRRLPAPLPQDQSRPRRRIFRPVGRLSLDILAYMFYRYVRRLRWFLTEPDLLMCGQLVRVKISFLLFPNSQFSSSLLLLALLLFQTVISHTHKIKFSILLSIFKIYFYSVLGIRKCL